MQPSSRLDRLPPYLFAELERKIREKRAAGVDVISLGIGDPDTPTPQPVIDALAQAASDPGTHQYPSNRGRPEFREAFARFYERRFGVTLDPETEIIPALGAKECVFNLNLAFLDPDSVALAADPGYPVYTGGPLLAGGGVRARARRADGARRLVHRDDLRRLRGAELPRDPGRQGRGGGGVLALEGLEHDRVAHGRDPRQRRRRGGVLEAQDQHRLGDVRGRAAGNGRRPRRGPPGRDDRALSAPPRPRLRRARRDRRGRDPAEGHDLRVGAGA